MGTLAEQMHAARKEVMTRPIVFLDTETTSLRLDRDAWEIGIIRRDSTGAEARIQMFIDVDVTQADPRALDVGGYWARHPRGKWMADPTHLSATDQDTFDQMWSRRDAARAVAKLTHAATIVGAVPDFDTQTLTRLLFSNGMVPTWHHRLRCVETLTAGHMGWDVGGLGECAAALGIEVPVGAAHTALGDAETAMRIWDLVLGDGPTS